MIPIMRGIVKDGMVIPERPLPEGETVLLRLLPDSTAFTEEEQKEFDLLAAAGCDALLQFEEELNRLR